MSKWGKFIGLVGLVVFLFGVLGALLIRDFTEPLLVLHLVLGVVLLVIWFLQVGLKNLGQAGHAFKGRRARFGANALLYTIVFAGLLVVANWLANRHDQRWDLTQEGAFSLAQQSRDIIRNLKAPLKIVGLVNVNAGDDDALRELLNLYKSENPTKVSTEVVDPNAKPHLLDKYDFKSGNFVYLAYGEGDKPAVSRLNEGSEEAITNGIIKLSRGAAKKIYYVEGHDEPGREDQSPQGAKALIDAIGDQNLTVEGIFLAQQGNLPDDAAAVIVNSPKKPMAQAEKDALLKFADAGGRLYLFGDPRTTSDIRDLAAHFGIEVGSDVVIDQVQRLFAAPALGAQPIVRDYGSHPITKNLKRTDVTVYNIASTVKTAAQKVEGATYTELVKTGSSAWGETNLDLLFSDDASAVFDQGVDAAGPVALGMAYEKKIDSTEPIKEGDPKFDQSTRVVVFGDSDWIINANLQVYSNRDLALSALNWLIGEEGGISIQPRAVGPSAAPISQQSYMLILGSSFLAPELLLIFGLYVWWRRRAISA
ncbi:MAG: GldG family protein [Oligoflexia bacterium]|nr:GldG family protein [Oligoflexia bacterium]